MDYRLLGRSGFKVSELTYGNWVTHGSQIGDEQAIACVRAALECGITSFDTADVYARGRAEEILGRALRASAGRGWRSSRRSTAPWATAPTTSA
jgi:aryl-alcohol dehydrogenase-like predicted oxidoreductase